ncbi:sperm acrosome membrane-associated protein 6-like [Rhinoderma darwinii]|uniref:sperm acrosome membrane-associated protein 6-like n=1 Tax=Rhinoderma darwinii TaxID=43563 RepID=UPI003F676619
MRFKTFYYLRLQIVILLCGAEVVTSCLNCFTTPADRASICHYPVSLKKMEAIDCLQRLHRGFEPLTDTVIAFSQIQRIRLYLKGFEKEVQKISELYFPPSWVEQFEIKIAEFVKGVKDRAASHTAAECKPPCGLQKEARVFKCSRCAEEDCKLPVTCPHKFLSSIYKSHVKLLLYSCVRPLFPFSVFSVEEMHVIELEKTIIHCRASFPLPDYATVVWKYAKNMKATDLGYFKDIYSGEDLFVMIEPTRASHTGTYACEVTDEDDDIILRQFYYLDVTQTDTREASEVERYFRHALESTKIPEEKEEEMIKHVPSTLEKIQTFFQSYILYAIYAGVCCLIVTLLVGALWRYALSVD